MSPAATRICRFVPRPALILVCFAVTCGLPAQEARIAASTMKIEPASAEKKVRVSLRLADTVKVTGAVATLKGAAGEVSVPVAWKAFDSMPAAKCAWMIVVDNSNPARRQTITACAEEVRSFLKLLPKEDVVMIASLARDLVVAAPFESSPAQLEAALAGMKAEGDASFASLIFQNVKHGLAGHLTARPEERRCVVLLTDGKDETPGGPLRVTERRNELIAEAKKLGIAIHTLGFAEKAAEANYFADLKELSLQTDGLHVPASVSTRQLPDDTWPGLIGAMRSGGTAVLDLTEVKEPAELRMELTCENGRSTSVAIPREIVKKIVPDAPAAAVPNAQTLPQVEAEAPAMPKWIVWAAGGVILLLLVVMKARQGKRRDAQAKAQAPTRAVQTTPVVETSRQEPPAVPLVYLQVMDGGAKRHAVTAKGVKIGSGRHNDIVIEHHSVSADHGALFLQKGEWIIADTGSVNGLRVNGTYYHQASLNPGDEIELGEVKMRFLAE